MSRFFNGPTTQDGITFSPGNAPPDQGPITVMALFRAASSPFTGWILSGNIGASRIWSMLVDTGKLYCENDFGTGGPSHGTGWCWFGYTKDPGAAIPRWHMHDITAGSAWVHVNDSSNVGDGSGPITSIVMGNGGSAANTFRGRGAAAAAWASKLSDGAIEAACTLAAADLAAASPNWGVLLNQASTATSVVDFTGGGGNQTALSGTSVDADEPPGWSYTLGPTTTPFTRDYGINWRVLNGFTKDVVVNWRVLAAFTRDTVLNWRVLGAFTRDYALSWRVLATWQRDYDARWRVLAALQRDVDVRWRVLGAFAADTALAWRVLGSFTRDYALAWRVLASWQRDTVLLWNVLSDTAWTKDVQLNWRVRAALVRDYELRWRILSALPTVPSAADADAHLVLETTASLEPVVVDAYL
jgi:hypothetical protein